MIRTWSVSKYPLIKQAGKLLTRGGTIDYVDSPSFDRLGAMECNGGRAQIIPVLGPSITFGRYLPDEAIWFGFAFRLPGNWEFNEQPETIALLQHSYAPPLLTDLARPPAEFRVIGSKLELVHAWFPEDSPVDISAQLTLTVPIHEGLMPSTYYPISVRVRGAIDDAGEVQTFIGADSVDYRHGPNHTGDAPIYPVVGLQSISARNINIGAILTANMGDLHDAIEVYAALREDV